MPEGNCNHQKDGAAVVRIACLGRCLCSRVQNGGCPRAQPPGAQKADSQANSQRGLEQPQHPHPCACRVKREAIFVYKISGELESPDRPNVTVKWFVKT